jgi:hypothetical protein
MNLQEFCEHTTLSKQQNYLYWTGPIDIEHYELIETHQYHE